MRRHARERLHLDQCCGPAKREGASWQKWKARRHDTKMESKRRESLVSSCSFPLALGWRPILTKRVCF